MSPPQHHWPASKRLDSIAKSLQSLMQGAGTTVKAVIRVLVAQVTQDNFAETLPDVQQALASCAFFAFDCEFTGLHVRDTRACFYEDMQHVYMQVSARGKVPRWPCSALVCVDNDCWRAE